MNMNRLNPEKCSSISVYAQMTRKSIKMFGNKDAAGLKYILIGNFMNKVLYFGYRMNSFLLNV